MSQSDQLITDHIDVWTSAILAKSTSGRGSNKKYELYGITKLRELILELAVRGKLVPQDPNDEPASVLLEKIAAEKAELIKEKQIKKPKNLPKIEDDNMLFEVPSGWCWAYLQDVSSYIQRGKGPNYAEDGKVRVVSQKCVQWKGFDLTPCRYISDESLDKYQEERYLQNNDLLWNSTGTGTVGRINTIDNIKTSSLVADSHVTVIRPIKLNSTFLRTYISSPFIQRRIDPNSENPLVSGSTKQVELNTSVVISLLTPLPPLAEQYRIVAKVDELMLLCDDLERQTEASIDAHATLVEVLLATLTDSADANELAENWTRIAKHFDSLFTTEQSIDALKQAVLQLAVMGKLVPQNSEDEPALALLGKSHKEKETLIKEGVIKREKALPLIDDCEKPFDVPQGWAYSRGNLLADFIDPQPSHRTPPVCQNGVPYIGYTDIFHEYGIDFDNARKVSPNVFEEHKNRYTLKDGDFVFGKIGTLGKPFFLPQPFDYCLSANLIVIQPNLLVVNPKFLSVYLDSPILKEIMGNQKTNSTHGVFGIKKARLLVIPLPPLNEQHRIVAKVDELMQICDQLKAKLQQSQIIQVQLTDALVDQALA